MPAPLSRAVPGSQAFQHDALDVVVSADGEKIVGVGTGKPGNDTARPGQGKPLKRRCGRFGPAEVQGFFDRWIRAIPGRRQLVKLGAAGVAGAVVAKVATSQPAGAAERLGGIRISVMTQVVKPEASKGFPHHWTLTVYGSDDALNGMGWGGATDLETAQDVFNSKMFPCIVSLTGAVEGDLVKLHGLMLFSGAPDQGLPVTFEGNLKTGALHANGYNTFDFDGSGIVARI